MIPAEPTTGLTEGPGYGAVTGRDSHFVNRILDAVGRPVIISVVVAFGVGALTIAATGSNPVEAYSAMF